MKRTLAVLVFAGLAAWASAQPPTTGATVAEELRHLKANSTLLENLLNHGVHVSNASTPLDRADKCRAATEALRLALQDAGDDPDRIVELTEQLIAMLTDGLAPTLLRARTEIPRGSHDYERMKKLHTDVRQDLVQVQSAIPTTGKSGRSKRVSDARQQLTTAAASVPTIND